MSVFNQQKKICKKFGLVYQPCDENLYLYISKNFNKEDISIEGKRYVEIDNFSGWYIWSGEEPREIHLYEKVIISDINQYSDALIKFLWLERGTRFLIEEDYINAEFDYRVEKMID